MVCATTISTCPNIHASSSCSITHPPCFYLKTTMPYSCALTSYSLISITMHTLCVYHEEPMSLDITPNPNSFQTLLNPSRPLVLLDHSRLCHMTSRSCALHPSQTNNYLLFYVWLTLTLAKVCLHSCLITSRKRYNQRSCQVTYIWSSLSIKEIKIFSKIEK